MAIWLGETTTLALAATKKTSLRTTVPMSVVKQFGLTAGDKLDWSFDVKEGAMIIIVRPIKLGEAS
jgi:hypothetical protein